MSLFLFGQCSHFIPAETTRKPMLFFKEYKMGYVINVSGRIYRTALNDHHVLTSLSQLQTVSTVFQNNFSRNYNALSVFSEVVGVVLFLSRLISS